MKLARIAILALLVAGCERGDTPSGASGDVLVAYSRENNSGTYMYFKEHVLENADFDASVQTLPGTAAVINAVAKDRRAIGYGGIGYLKGVRALAVARDAASPAIEPTMENVVTGKYPISRRLYFYTVGAPEGAVREFIEWVRAEPGQKVCEAVGYFPLPEAERAKTANGAKAAEEKRTITLKGSDTMVILGQRWAENYMQSRPDFLVQVTGGGSGTGIAALINGSTDICMASRPMKPKEREQAKAKHGKDVVEFSVAMDGVAVFVNESNALRQISLPQLKDIYTGKVQSWGELGPAPK